MDEQILFDRFHEALETEPRPGAYERMRLAMTNNPIALKRRPAYRMRWTRMGLRMAAALTAAAIAIAVFAVFLATHHAPVGSVPAGPDKSISAYQALIRANDVKMNVATSNHCVTIQDAGCAAAVLRVDAALQQWIDDLNVFNTPPSFTLLDGELRHHLAQAIKDLNATVTFQKDNNANAFDMAIGAASYERDWIDNAASALEARPGAASQYKSAVGFAKQSLDSCSTCEALPTRQCTGTSVPSCEIDVQAAEFQTQAALIAVLGNPAPGALVAKDASLKADFAAADAALLALTDALLGGDSAAAQAGQRAFSSAVHSIDGDASAVSNS